MGSDSSPLADMIMYGHKHIRAEPSQAVAFEATGETHIIPGLVKVMIDLSSRSIGESVQNSEVSQLNLHNSIG